MPTYTPRDVRAWALANDVPCSTTGKIGKAAVEAYLASSWRNTRYPEALAADPEGEAGDTWMVVSVDIPGDLDAEAPLARAASDLIAVAYEAGYAAGQRDKATEFATALHAAGLVGGQS